MKLPRTEHTALLLAVTLAGEYGKKQISLLSISEKHGISAAFLKKLARALRQSDIVKSKEGFGGGYELAKSPDRISLWDIVNSVSHMDEKNSQPKGHMCPVNMHCLPQTIQKTIDEALEERLSSISLKDLV